MGAESSAMQNAATACKGCKNLGDKQVDTVKIDMTKVSEPSNATGKENSSPGQMAESQAEKSPSKEQKLLKQAEEQEAARRRAEEEASERQRRRVLEMHKQLEQENEMRKQQEEQERQHRIQEDRIAEQKRRQAEEEEERLRLIQKEKEEEEEQQRLLQQKEEAEDRRKNESLSAFLGKAGFNAVGEKKVKKSMMSSSSWYPLHAAVDMKDAEAVSLLLWAGADPKLPNSKKLTPLKLAEAKNKQGSHDKVIAALAA